MAGRRPGSFRLAVPVVFVMAGILFATSAATSRGTDLRSVGRDRLTDRIANVQRTLRDLERESTDLRQQVQAQTLAQSASDGRVGLIQRQLDALGRTAGLSPLSGKGLTVALSDAPKRRPGDHYPAGVPAPTPDDLVVHQQDVQAVVNAMWAGGARGMTIMGQRVISTSAVRCVGNTLLLHGVVYSPPFTVTAVGDPAAMRRALDRAPGVQLFLQYVNAYHLVLQQRALTTVTLPAYDGTLELTHATAVGT